MIGVQSKEHCILGMALSLLFSNLSFSFSHRDANLISDDLLSMRLAFLTRLQHNDLFFAVLNLANLSTR